MLAKLLIQKWTMRREIALFIICSTPLIINHYWVNPRDAGAYVQGGLGIISGSNPYLDGVFRGGVFGSVTLAALLKDAPLNVQALIFLGLNLVGTWSFTRIFVSATLPNLLLCTLVLWSSANRTNLDTIQLTGLILGWVSLVYKIIDVGNERRPQFVLPISLLSAVLVDLKPHILIPFILIYCFWTRRFDFLLMCTLCLSLGHLAMGLLFGFGYVVSWIHLILEIGESQSFQKFDGAAHNYWQLVTYYVPDPSILLQVIPFTLYLLFIAYSCKGIARFNRLGAIMLSSLSLSITSYSHFYDLVPLVALALVILSQIRFTFWEFGFLCFILVPQNWHSWQIASILFMVVSVYAFFRIKFNHESANLGIKSVIVMVLKSGLAGALTFFLLQSTNANLPLPNKLIDAVTTTELVLMALLIACSLRRFIHKSTVPVRL